MSDQPSRLDRIEAALALQMELNVEFRTRQERQNAEFHARQEIQMELNAEFRTRQEIQSRQISELRESMAIAMERDNTLRDTLEVMIIEFNRHRSDGHGA
jgi:hypothetical protein